MPFPAGADKVTISVYVLRNVIKFLEQINFPLKFIADTISIRVEKLWL